MEGNASCGVVFLLGIALMGCRQPPREPVTLQYAYSWNEDRPQARALLQRFTQETGIRVTNIPIPEYTREYLDLARKLLKDGSGPDLLNIDLIWSPILEPDLIDLQPYLAAEIARLEPQLLRQLYSERKAGGGSFQRSAWRLGVSNGSPPRIRL